MRPNLSLYSQASHFYDRFLDMDILSSMNLCNFFFNCHTRVKITRGVSNSKTKQSLAPNLIKHLFQLIRSFRLIWKLHGLCVGAGLELNSAGLRPPGTETPLDQDEFVSSSDLEKCVSASVSQQWILCSEWVPSKWVQTADKNITIIHNTPVHQLTSWEDKRWNKSIKTLLTKIRVHNNSSSSEKVHLLLSLTSKSSHIFVVLSKRCLICAYFSPDSDQNTFSLEEALLWIIDSYFSYKHLNDGLV